MNKQKDTEDQFVLNYKKCMNDLYACNQHMHTNQVKPFHDLFPLKKDKTGKYSYRYVRKMRLKENVVACIPFW